MVFAARKENGRTYNHHCRICRGAVTERCWDKYHIARCEECNEIFQAFSKTGCNDHGYGDGYNLSVKKVKSGLPADHRTSFELQQEDVIRVERERRAAETTRAAAIAVAAERARQEEDSRKGKRAKKSKLEQRAERRRRRNQN